jgi:hypothetical protein
MGIGVDFGIPLWLRSKWSPFGVIIPSAKAMAGDAALISAGGTSVCDAARRMMVAVAAADDGVWQRTKLGSIAGPETGAALAALALAVAVSAGPNS